MAKMHDGPNGVLLVDATDHGISMERTLLFEQGKFFISGLEISKIISSGRLPKFTNSMFTTRYIEEYLLEEPQNLNQNDATEIVGKWDLSEPYNPNDIRIFTPEHNKKTCMKSILVAFHDNPPRIYIELQDSTLPNSLECNLEIPVKPGENKYVKAFQEVCLVAEVIARGHTSNFAGKTRLLGL